MILDDFHRLSGAQARASLRFGPTEAAEFLNGRLALDLAPGDVALLVARTEGWPAGIYLAALSLAGKPDKSALVHAFDGTSAPRKPASIERSAWALQHAR